LGFAYLSDLRATRCIGTWERVIEVKYVAFPQQVIDVRRRRYPSASQQ
jgi:hypothetical protein